MERRMDDRREGKAGAPSVLCVDDDRDVAEVVQAILTDEGYLVSCLYELADDALLRAVGRLEPDVILLDSASATDYNEAWHLAASVHERSRPVPVVMFTAHHDAVTEAREGTSRRAGEAHFAAVVRKPFEVDELIAAVAEAAGQSQPFDRRRAADEARTRALVAALEAKGATDVRPSKMREWALFRDRKGRLLQLYWWQTRGVYQLGRYREGGQMTMVGQFIDREAAVEVALPAL
jgi:CheY-like chemotaxis protein